MEVKKVCEICGKSFFIPSYYGKGRYCSKQCAGKAYRAKPNVKCAVCGRPMHKKPREIKNSKTGQFCCSHECRGKLCQDIYKGNNNPNYMHRKDRLIVKINGRPYYRIYDETNPNADKKGTVLVHRYVVEQNRDMFDKKYFDKDGYLYPDVDVHHKDMDTTNNDISNLMPVTKSEHTTLHNKMKRMIRDKKGRIKSIQRLLKVSYKRKTDTATVPRYAHKGDAGVDLYVDQVEWVEGQEGKQLKCHSNIAIEIPKNHVGMLYCRSSICKRGMMLSCSVGIIDSGFRDEITAIFNVISEDYDPYKVGERFAQLIIIPIPDIEFKEVDELTETDRGKGGYGSTGK